MSAKAFKGLSMDSVGMACSTVFGTCSEEQWPKVSGDAIVKAL